MSVLLSVYTFSTVTCTVGRFYYLCAWTLKLLISFALPFIYTFPQIYLWLFTNVVFFVPLFIQFCSSFSLTTKFITWMFSLKEVFFFFCTKTKNLSFIQLSVSFTTPKCDFSKVLSCGLLHIEKERKMEWKEWKTGVKQVWKGHIRISSKLFMLCYECALKICVKSKQTIGLTELVYGVDRGGEEIFFCLFSSHVGSILQCMRHYLFCSSDQPSTKYNF